MLCKSLNRLLTYLFTYLLTHLLSIMRKNVQKTVVDCQLHSQSSVLAFCLKVTVFKVVFSVSRNLCVLQVKFQIQRKSSD